MIINYLNASRQSVDRPLPNQETLANYGTKISFNSNLSTGKNLAGRELVVSSCFGTWVDEYSYSRRALVVVDWCSRSGSADRCFAENSSFGTDLEEDWCFVQKKQ